jgi:RNA polymerase sigma-70 factor (ECF subfamily)
MVLAAGAATAPTATFDDLLARHRAELYGYALRLTRDRADADDLYQETLLRAFRAFARLDAAANHRAWLYKIATTAYLGDRRRAGREGPLDEARLAALPAAQADPAERAAGLDAGELLREVAADVGRLPAKQRAALVLRRYHGLGYGEVAARLGCDEAAARANVHRALCKLRARFGDRL